MDAATGSVTDCICILCTEEFNNPRFLPCHHTFCFQCIENLILSKRPSKNVPCPLCRSMFDVPASSLQTNFYAEELIRLTRDAERQMGMVRDEVAAVKTQLEETEEARQEAIGKSSRLDAALGQTRSTLAEVRKHSSQVEQQLGSRISELERKLLSDAECRESCLREVQREAMEQMRDAERRCEAAKIEAENCRRAKEDAETSAIQAEQSCESLRQQMQQVQCETQEQLKDAEHRQKAANAEAETHKRAKNGIESSLAKTRKSYRSLQQSLQQSQQDAAERTKMLESELGQSRQNVISLSEQLATARLKLVQQEDYKKSHTEGLLLRLYHHHHHHHPRISSRRKS